MTAVDLALSLLAERGAGTYFGEAVTQREHALQCAHLAALSGANEGMIAAALLHDIGHLLHDVTEGTDGRHEKVGAAWVLERFGPAVADPIRLHVPAKRYLCATDPVYMTGLSPASVTSLHLQGGPFTPEETWAFEGECWWREAVALRRWDDMAKVPGLAVPGLEAYRPVLEAAFRRGEGR
jgi:phosphonate degradation associated HDIG domain protein